MEKIKTISCQDLQNVDGELLAGTILGGTVGLVGIVKRTSMIDG